MGAVKTHGLRGCGLAVAGFLLLGAVLGGCSGSRSQVASAPGPAPTGVQTRLSLAGASSARYLEVTDGDRNSSSLDGYDPAAGEQGNRRLALRALQKVANTLRRLEDRSLQELLDEYQDRFDSLEKQYDSVEDFVTNLGVEQREFRQGVGISAATAAATLGTLHALKPVAVSSGLLGTSFRAGYDVSRLDDPRMMLGYSDRLRVTVSKNGFGGTISGERMSYTGDINIRRMEASANMTLDRNLTVGTLYAHNDQAVQGFVRLDF